MRVKSLFALIVGAILIFTAGFADARRADDEGIRGQIASQQRRIDRGVSSGELTRREARTLRDNLREIRAEHDRARADGVVTRKERRRIERHLEQNSEMIRMKKRNPVRRIY
jgi:polyhydroxyalkanoate synthesis regulator phasin